MQRIILLYSTDSHGRVVYTDVKLKMNRDTIVITDIPYVDRVAFSSREIHVGKKPEDLKTMRGTKPVAFVESVKDAMVEAVSRTDGEDIVVTGSAKLIKGVERWADIAVVKVMYHDDIMGKGLVSLNDKYWERKRLIVTELEREYIYERKRESSPQACHSL